MRLRGAVSTQLAVTSLLVTKEVGGSFASSQQSAKRSTGSGILNHSSAGAAGQKLLGKREHFPEPVENMRFQFRTRRAGRPQHSLHTQSGRKQVAQNRRSGSIAREVGVEIRRLPVRNSRKNHVIDICQ